MKTLIAVGLLALAIQDDPVVTEALKGYHHPWSGFQDGSMVVYRETTRRPTIDDSGKLIQKEVASEYTWSVALIEGEKVTLRIEGGGQESAIPHFMGFPSWARGRGEKRGTEDITVGDRIYKCDVTAILLDVEKDAGQMTTICRSSEAPTWAVRRRVETLVRGKPNTTEEEVLTAVDQKLKVGESEVRCVIVTVTVDSVGGVRTVRKEWRSDEVPGRVLKSETRQFARGKEIESAASQMEVVKFRARR